MSLKENLPKWVLLSIAKHFTDSIDSDLHVFIEGTERAHTLEGDWAEIRVNGPDMAEVSKGVFRAQCEVDILVATHIDFDNPTLHISNVGKVSAHFDSNIELYEYGDGGSKVGCLKLSPTDTVSDNLDIINRGQIDPNLDLYQTNVVGIYKIYINE